MTVQLIRRQAKELAAAFFEGDDEARTERFRAFWPGKDGQKQFVGRMWPSFVPMARALLTDMLSRNDVATYLKDEIAEALIEDNKRAVTAPSFNEDGHQMLLKAAEPGKVEQKFTKALEDLN